MFKNILVAIDGSDCSSNAVPTAIEVARRFHAKVHVLHVHEHDRGRASAFPLVTKENADQLVADAIGIVKAAGIDVRGEVRIGFIGQIPERIVEVAREQDTDLIVMGSRGLSDLAGVFLGSVTHGVIRLADAAVLIDRSPHLTELVQVGDKGTSAAA